MATKEVEFKVIVDVEGGKAGVKKLEKEFDNLALKSKSVGETLKANFSFTDTVQGANLAFSAISNIISKFGEFTADAIEAERASFRFSSALRNNGLSILEDDLNSYAETLRNKINVDDDDIKSNMALALQYGATASNIEEVTKNALALSIAYDKDLATTTRLAILAADGNYSALVKLIPQLKGVKNESEQLAIYTKTVSDAFKVAEDRARSYGGKVDDLKIRFEGLREDAGEGLLKTFFAITDQINKAGAALAKPAQILRDMRRESEQTKTRTESELRTQQALNNEKDKAKAILSDNLKSEAEALELKDKQLKAQIAINEANEKNIDYRSPEQLKIISQAKPQKYSKDLKTRALFTNDLDIRESFSEIEGLTAPIIDNLRKVKDDSQQVFTDMKDNLSASFSSAFQLILKDSNNFSEAMQGVFDSLINSITQSITDRLANNLVNTLFDLFPGGSIISQLFNFAPSLGGSGGGSVASQLSNIERAIKIMDSNNRDVTAKYQSVFNAQVLTDKQLYKTSQSGKLKLQAVE